MMKVARQSISILGKWGGRLDYLPEVVDLMRAGELHVKAIISAVMPMSQWQEAFHLLHRKEAINILLDPAR